LLGDLAALLTERVIARHLGQNARDVVGREFFRLEVTGDA
jgi:hypothetical protein